MSCALKWENDMNILRNMMVLLTALSLWIGPLHAEVDGLNVVAPKREFPRVSRSYESMDKVFSRTGRERSVAQVRQVEIGTDKEGLVRAVGRPVSSYDDGSWNFNISLDFPQTNRLICQYRVWFDENDRVSGTAWRRPQCANIILTGNGN